MPQESYFTRIDEHRFESNIHTQGAWNTEEQHVAPAFGLLLHETERDFAARRDDSLVITRASFDIYGVYRIEPVSITTRVLRPGRTVELVESTLWQDDRAAIVLRAWLLKNFDTAAIAADEFDPLPPRSGMGQARFTTDWPGAAVQSIEAVSDEAHPGRAHLWARPKVQLLDGEQVSPTARATGMFDFANGLTPRARPGEVLFPNLDLTAHYLRAPEGDWLGYDTRVSYSAGGTGITHTVFHDERGPFAVSTQGLTVRQAR